MNCHCQLEEHPVGDVEPLKFVVYLTQAAIKLPSAGDARSGVQRTLQLSVTVLGAPARTVLQ